MINDSKHFTQSVRKHLATCVIKSLCGGLVYGEHFADNGCYSIFYCSYVQIYNMTILKKHENDE